MSDQSANLYQSAGSTTGIAVGPAPQATATSGATHPCERVFQVCAAGADCPFRDAPREACLAFLKGRCRFGESCREPHFTAHQGTAIMSPVHPCLRIYGSCRYGDQCNYANLPADTCVKFLKGRCTFGDRCKEVHPGAVTTMGWATSGVGAGMMAAPAMAMPPQMPGMAPGIPPGMPPGMPPMPAGMGMPGAVPGMPMGMPMPAMPGYDMQQMGMQMMPMYMPAYGTPQEADPTLRGKRSREGDADGAAWKRQSLTPENAAFDYLQSTGGGQLHPCVRIFGTCRDGAACRFALAPIGACLQFLKGTCKFGTACHETHVQIPGQEHRQKGPGSKHPCERVYGFCKDGDHCRFVDYPAESCVMYLKGKCRFGDACRELHARDPNLPLEEAATSEKR